MSHLFVHFAPTRTLSSSCSPFMFLLTHDSGVLMQRVYLIQLQFSLETA